MAESDEGSAKEGAHGTHETTEEGLVQLRTGRIDTYKELGYASVAEQRQRAQSDLARYNAKRRAKGRKELSEVEFEARAHARETGETNALSSSISASEGEDEEQDDDQSPDFSVHSSGALLSLPVTEDQRAVCWRCAVLSSNVHATSEQAALNNFASARFASSLRYAVLLARGGHFAGAVYDLNGGLGFAPIGDAIVHKALHRYVVRAQAGGRQSSKDAGKSIQSAGSSLRRHNEAALERDMKDTLASWAEYLKHANAIFVQAAEADKKALFKESDSPLLLSDSRVRFIPFPTRRPTYKETKRALQKLLEVRFEDVEDRGNATASATTSADTAPNSGETHYHQTTSTSESKENSGTTSSCRGSKFQSQQGNTHVARDVPQKGKSKNQRDKERKQRKKEREEQQRQQNETNQQNDEDADNETKQRAKDDARVRQAEQCQSDRVRAKTGRSGQRHMVPYLFARHAFCRTLDCGFCCT